MNEHNNVAVWACPACGRTVQVRLPAYWTPNRMCQCQFPAVVYMMKPITDAARHVEKALAE